MDGRMINVGFGNSVVASRILLVVNPHSSPVRKLKEEAKKNHRLVDVTEGRRTRSIIILDSNHLVLSSVHTETITQRFMPATAEQQLAQAMGGIQEELEK